MKHLFASILTTAVIVSTLLVPASAAGKSVKANVIDQYKDDKGTCYTVLSYKGDVTTIKGQRMYDRAYGRNRVEVLKVEDPDGGFHLEFKKEG